MLDTNIFNLLLDGKISLAIFPETSSLFATPIQRIELEQTKDDRRREELLSTFNAVGPTSVSANFSFDVLGAGFDEGNWAENQDTSEILAVMNIRRPDKNNLKDSLIAECAKRHKFTLWTADSELHSTCTELGIDSKYIDQ